MAGKAGTTVRVLLRGGALFSWVRAPTLPASEADVEGILQPLVPDIVCLGHSRGGSGGRLASGGSSSSDRPALGG